MVECSTLQDLSDLNKSAFKDKEDASPVKRRSTSSLEITTVCLKNLTFNTEISDLQAFLTGQGLSPDSVELHRDPQGAFKGTAFVQFNNQNAATSALDTLGSVIDLNGRRVKVQLQRRGKRDRYAPARDSLADILGLEEVDQIKELFANFSVDTQETMNLPVHYSSEMRKYAHALAEKHGYQHLTKVDEVEGADGKKHTFVHISKVRSPKSADNEKRKSRQSTQRQSTNKTQKNRKTETVTRGSRVSESAGNPGKIHARTSIPIYLGGKNTPIGRPSDKGGGKRRQFSQSVIGRNDKGFQNFVQGYKGFHEHAKGAGKGPDFLAPDILNAMAQQRLMSNMRTSILSSLVENSAQQNTGILNPNLFTPEKVKDESDPLEKFAEDDKIAAKEKSRKSPLKKRMSREAQTFIPHDEGQLSPSAALSLADELLKEVDDFKDILRYEDEQRRKITWKCDLASGNLSSPSFRLSTSADIRLGPDPGLPPTSQPFQLKLIPEGKDGNGKPTVMVVCNQGARMKFTVGLNDQLSGKKVLLGTKFWVDFADTCSQGSIANITLELDHWL